METPTTCSDAPPRSPQRPAAPSWTEAPIWSLVCATQDWKAAVAGLLSDANTLRISVHARPPDVRRGTCPALALIGVLRGVRLRGGRETAIHPDCPICSPGSGLATRDRAKRLRSRARECAGSKRRATEAKPPGESALVSCVLRSRPNDHGACLEAPKLGLNVVDSRLHGRPSSRFDRGRWQARRQVGGGYRRNRLYCIGDRADARPRSPRCRQLVRSDYQLDKRVRSGLELVN